MVKYKIAILGKSNSGKNTICKLIARSLGLQDSQYNMVAFADPIKNMILSMFPGAKSECLFGKSSLRSEVIPNAFKDGNPLSYRQALIDLGSLGRSYNEDIWVNKFNVVYKETESDDFYQAILVNDVRFSNEFKYLKNNGFFVIKLVRDTDNKINHISETGQDQISDDDFDFVCNNNGTLDDLKKIINTQIIPKIKL